MSSLHHHLRSKSFPAETLAFVTAETIRSIQAILHAGRIDCVVLKGPHLAYTIYSNPTDRAWSDLDILLRPSHLQSALSLLSDHGFIMSPVDIHRLATSKEHYNVSLMSPLGLILELHRALSSHRRYPVDIDLFISEAEPFSIMNVEAKGLKPEHLLIHLCIHMMNDYFLHERKHFEDIALLLRRRTIIWDEFIHLARGAGCAVGAHYIFSALQRQKGSIVPESVFTALRPGRLRTAWLNLFLDPNHLPVYKKQHHSYGRAMIFLALPLLDRVKCWLPMMWKYGCLRFLDIYYSLNRPTHLHLSL